VRTRPGNKGIGTRLPHNGDILVIVNLLETSLVPKADVETSVQVLVNHWCGKFRSVTVNHLCSKFRISNSKLGVE